MVAPMKNLIAILLLFSLAAFAAVKNSAKLEWDYSAAEVLAVRFNVYSATNVAGPFTVFTNVAGTNVVIPITEGAHFYYVTATNEWGESDPSNVASATVVRRGQGLRITPQ